MSSQGNSPASNLLVRGPYRGDPTDAVRLVGTVAGILSIAAGVIHISAAGDHTDLPVMFAGFMVVAALQVALGALLLWRRPSRLLIAAGVALMVTSLGLWLLSRTAGLPFLAGGHLEPVGFKDGATKLFEIASIPALLLLLSRDLGGVALPSPRLGNQVLATLGAGIIALLVPALLLNGGEHHTHAEALALGIHDAGHESADALAHEDSGAGHAQGKGGHQTTNDHEPAEDHGDDHGGSTPAGGHGHSGTEMASLPLHRSDDHTGGHPRGGTPKHHADGKGEHKRGQDHKSHRKGDQHQDHHSGGGHGNGEHEGGHGEGDGGGSGSDDPVTISYEPSPGVCVALANICLP